MRVNRIQASCCANCAKQDNLSGGRLGCLVAGEEVADYLGCDCFEIIEDYAEEIANAEAA